MKEDKKAISRFENNKKISIHERWKQDSNLMTILCKDGKIRTFEERDKLREKGIDV
ncbi:MAG: hypothetical protein II988_00035 [Clostridia bacterium]|nr:hypothetical protein [Clostridia bacterium]